MNDCAAEWLGATLDDHGHRTLARLLPDARLRTLFGAGCCRLVWPVLAALGDRFTRPVEAAEAHADGGGTRAAVVAAVDAVVNGPAPGGYGWREVHVVTATLWFRYGWGSAAVEDMTYAATGAAEADAGPADPGAAADVVYRSVGRAFRPAADVARLPAARLRQGRLLEGIVGPDVPFDPTWRTAACVALARRAHDERAWHVLPILADALEDAGCDVPRMTAHLRGEGPFCRGLWVVDHLLGLRGDAE